MSEQIKYPKSYVYEQIGNKPRGNLYYLKYDADKVIAEQKEKYKELAKFHDKAIQACCDADKVINHQKYKRCKNMALKCDAYSVIFQYKVSILDDKPNLRNFYIRKRNRMDRWALRWFKLAKEFKREYDNGRR